MDLSRWLVDTAPIQAQLDEAATRNAEVEQLAKVLDGQPDHVIEAALNARFPDILTVCQEIAREDAAPKPRKPRTPKDEVTANARALADHADHEGLKLAALGKLAGLEGDALRSAGAKALRDGLLVKVDGLWRLA